MDPLLAASIGSSLVGGAVSGVQALRQAKQAKKIQVGQRSVSPESEAALAQLKSGATSGFTGKDVVEQQQGAAMANVLKGAKGSQRASTLAAAMQQGSENALNLAMQEAQAREANKQAYTSGLQQMGAEKRDIQEANIQDAIAAKTGLQQASSQNLQGMLQGFAGAGESAAMAYQLKKNKGK